MKYPFSIVLFFSLSVFVSSCKEQSKPDGNAEIFRDKALHLSSEEGIKWEVLGSKITGKVLSNHTNGKYAVIITETLPNGGPPKHIHTREDELFYVINGRYEFTCGNEIIIAEQGDMVHLPKGIPHSFKNIDTIMGRTMNTITPGGFENFFLEISSLSDRELLGKAQIDSLAEVYGIEFLRAN